MENETEKILEEQVLKLPREVTSFLASANWTETLEKISVEYKLNSEETTQFKNETVLVLAGLVNPDAYTETLGAVLGVNATLTAVVAAVEKEVFASIRPALVTFFNEERAHSGEEEMEKKQSVPEIPSPWAIPKDSLESEKPLPVTSSPSLVPLVLLPPVVLSVPKPAEQPVASLPPVPVDAPPANLPVKEEPAWTPRVFSDIPPAQPLPQTFTPLGKKTNIDEEQDFMHPFEKNMKNASMARPNVAESPVSSKVSVENMPAVPHYGIPQSSLVKSPLTTVVPPIVPVAPAPPVFSSVSPVPQTPRAEVLTEPVVSRAPQGPVTGVVAPTSGNIGGDPYREPIE